MITNSGKEIISKYMLGQSPAYATHISVGCGARPLNQTEAEQSGIASKTRMNFEMIRVPISSRGFVEEDGISKLSLIAQLPTEDRYEISEVALWSDASNSLAQGFDSKVIFNFEEDWQKHDTSITSIPLLESLGNVTQIIDLDQNIFRVNNGNSLLEAQERRLRKEGPRFLNTSIFVKGNSSNIESTDFAITSASSNGQKLTYSCTNTFSVGDKVTVTACSNNLFDVVNAEIVGASANAFSVNKVVSSSATSTGGVAWETGTWSPQESGSFTSSHIHLTNINFDISKNNPNDLLTLAFSLVDRDLVGNGVPQYVKILIEFLRNEIDTNTSYARAEIYVPGTLFTDRYKSISFPISDLITSSDFVSTQVRVAKIYSYVGITSGSAIVGSNLHYVALDGFRLDNISTNNPLYKMVGYSSTRTQDGAPVIKYRNTNNYVEFRFGIGVT